MNMQKVIVVNEKDEEIGTMPMSEAHKNGTPHRIAITYVENTAGQFLVQVRMPLGWLSTGLVFLARATVTVPASAPTRNMERNVRICRTSLGGWRR